MSPSRAFPIARSPRALATVPARGPSARGRVATVLLLLSTLIPAATLDAQENPAQDPPASRGPDRPSPAVEDGSPASPATRPTTGRAVARPGNRGRVGSFSGIGGPAAPTVGEGPACSLDATLYEVRIPAAQIGTLDIDALAKASATAAAFEKALAALGSTRPLYRANQSVRLSGDTITIGSEVPTVTSSRVTDSGQTVNTISYQSTGARFALAGHAAGGGGGGGEINLDLGIELSSAAADDGVAISDKAKAPIMRRATLSHKGPVELQRPFVILSVDAGSADKDGKAVAYIGRITLGEPRPPAAK